MEKGKIKYLGNLDIEPKNEEKKLTDVLKIKESNDGITFTFDTDSLLLKPEIKISSSKTIMYNMFMTITH